MDNNSDARSQWLKGYGPIQHREDTRQRIAALGEQLVCDRRVADADQLYAMLAAADTGWELSALSDYANLEEQCTC